MMSSRLWRATAIVCLFLALTSHTGVATVTTGNDLPAGFQAQTVLIGLTQPSGLAFTPDGRMLVIERNGVVKIAQPGASEVDTTRRS